jgi:hypothetical protein
MNLSNKNVLKSKIPKGKNQQKTNKLFLKSNSVNFSFFMNQKFILLINIFEFLIE